jgi:glycosyltransferase involved in cell wall biosynthesis
MGEFPAGLRVALVHDWLTGMRGGEKCLEVLAEIFPEAPLYTLLYVPGSVSKILEARPIHTSCIQKIPRAERIYRWALPMFPRAIERFDFDDYDLILSSSHCVAKSAMVPQDAVSVCYCHTPMRYVWDRFDDYFGDKPFPAKQLISWQASRLRRWDKDTAPRVDHWLANSTVVRQRILDWYGVAPEKVNIVHPPVDVGRFQNAGQLPVPAGLVSGGYDLVVSALVAYKKIDLAVKAALLAGQTLVVVGKGPELARLQELAEVSPGKGQVIFAGPVSDEDLPAYYGHCRCFVFPGLEDFGITPLEATAAGRPVVAYGVGGVLDTVTENVNGFFFHEQSKEAMAAALSDDRLNNPWDGAKMAAHVAGFSRDRYRREMVSEIKKALEANSTHRKV